MRIAVEGCCHGELDKIYAAILERAPGVDLLLICGDFQSIRNQHDLSTMAVPEKYKSLGNFHEYYTGLKKAPITTVFIGGNHEASNYLHELFYGGFVCPNIYYLGSSGVINFNGLRIGGLSGIYKHQHYENGFYERHPLLGGDIRSIYHIRRMSVYKLSKIRKNIDIMLSHDWPRGIAKHGDVKELLQRKKFLKQEIYDNTLGSPPAEELLKQLKPHYWFSAHLHTRFQAVYHHQNPDSTSTNPDEIDIQDSSDEEEEPAAPKTTVFLSLDKCVPNRDFLEIIDIPIKGDGTGLLLDREWIAILRATEALQSFSRFPNQYLKDSEIIEKINQEMEWVNANITDLTPPLFRISAPPHNPKDVSVGKDALVLQNPQTHELCQKMGIACRINPHGEIPQIITSFDRKDSIADVEEAKKRALERLSRIGK